MAHFNLTLNSQNVEKDIKICFVIGEFNKEFTSAMEEKTEAFLKANGFLNIDKYYVPGAFEIPAMTKRALDTKKYQLIITLWVVIRGDTPHFDYVCNECSRGIMNLTLENDTPIIFWLLTCNDEDQVRARIDDNFAISGINLLNEITRLHRGN